MAFGNPPGSPPGSSGGKRPKPTQRQLLTAGGIVLGGVVVLLGAIAVLNGNASPASEPASPTIGPTYSPTYTTSVPPPPPPPSVPQPDPSVVLHEGTLTLSNQSDGADLDSTAANWDEGPTSQYSHDVELAMNGSELHYPPGQSNFVRVDSSAPVSYATCSAATGAVDTFYGPGDASNQINERLRFCVRTTQDHFAFVRVLATPIDPNIFGGGLGSVTIKVTTWARSASAS